jgi:hypothetical protein
MRSSVVLLGCAVAVFLGGAALISVAVLGGALMFTALAAAAWALMRDDVTAVPRLHEVPTLAQVLQKARDAG